MCNLAKTRKSMI